MRAPRMQKLHVVFLACAAVNGGVNGTRVLSTAYLICTVRVRKSFGLLCQATSRMGPYQAAGQRGTKVRVAVRAMRGAALPRYPITLSPPSDSHHAVGRLYGAADKCNL